MTLTFFGQRFHRRWFLLMLEAATPLDLRCVYLLNPIIPTSFPQPLVTLTLIFVAPKILMEVA